MAMDGSWYDVHSTQITGAWKPFIFQDNQFAYDLLTTLLFLLTEKMQGSTET